MHPVDAGRSTDALDAWHRLDADIVATRFDVVPAHGLGAAAVRERQAVHGLNRLVETKRRPAWRMLVDQFSDVMVIVLAAAAVVAGVIGEPQDSIAIVAILVLNAALGFTQEFRAERAMQALRAMASPNARVRRGTELLTIPAMDLVPGDIVLLEVGAIVPADLRLLTAPNLQVDESALTGESLAVQKNPATLDSLRPPLSDGRNMAYKGTIVTAGRGEGVVVATGMRTELGRIASLLDQADDTRTPLQRRLKRFGSQLAVAVLVLCSVIFGIGLLRGEEPI